MIFFLLQFFCLNYPFSCPMIDPYIFHFHKRTASNTVPYVQLIKIHTSSVHKYKRKLLIPFFFFDTVGNFPFFLLRLHDESYTHNVRLCALNFWRVEINEREYSGKFKRAEKKKKTRRKEWNEKKTFFTHTPKLLTWQKRKEKKNLYRSSYFSHCHFHRIVIISSEKCYTEYFKCRLFIFYFVSLLGYAEYIASTRSLSLELTLFLSC